MSSSSSSPSSTETTTETTTDTTDTMSSSNSTTSISTTTNSTSTTSTISTTSTSTTSTTTTSTDTGSTTGPSINTTPTSTTPTSTSTSTTSSSQSPTSSDSSTSSQQQQSSSTTLSEPSTTAFQTTVFTTANGSMFTTVVETTSTISAGSVVPVSAAVKGNDSARVRAIVGGVVGGLAALILLGVLAFFYIRRQRQKRIEKEFDGNFDPAATDKRSSTFNSIRGPPVTTGGLGGTLPNVVNDDELLDDGMGGRLAPSMVGGGVISPFVLRQTSPPPSSPVSRTSADDPRRLSSERAFYNGRVSPQTTGSSYNPYANYGALHRRPISPSSSHPPSSFSYPSVNVYTSPDRPSSPSSGSEYTPSQNSLTSSSAKEQEARSRFALANPDHDANPFNGVTQEQRAGYIRTGPSPSSTTPQDHDGEDLTEIPPTYDSLPKA